MKENSSEAEALKAWGEYKEAHGVTYSTGGMIIELDKKIFIDGFKAGHKLGHKKGVAEGINLGEKHERERTFIKAKYHFCASGECEHCYFGDKGKNCSIKKIFEGDKDGK